MSLYDIEVRTIRGDTHSMAAYKGKVLLIVNTASKCGFTPQYKALQHLHETYGKQGLQVLGFPSNQFGNQEPDDEATIEQQCEMQHGVTFPGSPRLSRHQDDQMELYQIPCRPQRTSRKTFCSERESGQNRTLPS
jgi:glutathione peroxidase